MEPVTRDQAIDAIIAEGVAKNPDDAAWFTEAGEAARSGDRRALLKCGIDALDDTEVELVIQFVKALILLGL